MKVWKEQDIASVKASQRLRQHIVSVKSREEQEQDIAKELDNTSFQWRAEKNKNKTSPKN